MYLIYSGYFDALRKRYFRKILDRLALPHGSDVLDYGCGPGDFILLAREHGLRAVGVDNSEHSIRLAKEHGITVLQKTSKMLLAEPARYDAIIIQSVLEHVPDGVELASDLAKLLKPGGVLILSSPTPGPFFWDDPTHVRPYTPRSFLILAEIIALECDYLGYVFGFLLNFEIRLSLIFPLMNVIPLSLGSNLIAFLRKPAK